MLSVCALIFTGRFNVRGSWEFLDVAQAPPPACSHSPLEDVQLDRRRKPGSSGASRSVQTDTCLPGQSGMGLGLGCSADCLGAWWEGVWASKGVKDTGEGRAV